MTTFLSRTWRFLSSYGLSITVMGFLLLLTLLGTLEQTRTSLYEVQKRYFESVFVVHDIAGVPVPLPGVYLLLVVLAVNLIAGGIVRIRKSAATVGVLVVHLGIVVMLVGAMVEYYWSEKGHATLAEGDRTASFQSYYEWELAIAEIPAQGGPVTELVIPGAQWAHLSVDDSATFTSSALPFDLTVHHVLPNCRVVPAGADAVHVPVVDGRALLPLEREKEAEADSAGAYVTVKEKASGRESLGIVWFRERFPLTVMVEGRRFTIELAHRRWPLPFTVALDAFRREVHPGTGMPKAFESDVTRFDAAGVPVRTKISMNQPLRQAGKRKYMRA